MLKPLIGLKPSATALSSLTMWKSQPQGSAVLLIPQRKIAFPSFLSTTVEEQNSNMVGLLDMLVTQQRMIKIMVGHWIRNWAAD